MPLAPTKGDLIAGKTEFISSIESIIHDQWDQAWSIEKHGRATYKLIKAPTADVLQKFKSMSRAKSSVIVQARTGKIGLRDYLHSIGVETSPGCPCGAARQTVKHTLLGCPRHDEVRGEFLQVGDKDLTRFLETPALVVKVAKFLLATDELHQFRYTHAPVNSYERDIGRRQLVMVTIPKGSKKTYCHMAWKLQGQDERAVYRRQTSGALALWASNRRANSATTKYTRSVAI